MRAFTSVALVPLLLLSGCIDPAEGRPYEEFLAEYRALGFDVGPVDPEDLGRDTAPPAERCSVNGAAVVVEFVNGTATAGDLYWIDPDCERFRYASLAAGASHEQSTFEGHVWRLYSGNTVLGELVANGPDGTVLRFE